MTEEVSNQVAEFGKFYDVLIEFFASYSLQILGAIILLVIGIFLSKYVGKFVQKILFKYKVDETVSLFIANFVRILDCRDDGGVSSR